MVVLTRCMQQGLPLVVTGVECVELVTASSALRDSLQVRRTISSAKSAHKVNVSLLYGCQ